MPEVSCSTTTTTFATLTPYSFVLVRAPSVLARTPSTEPLQCSPQRVGSDVKFACLTDHTGLGFAGLLTTQRSLRLGA